MVDSGFHDSIVLSYFKHKNFNTSLRKMSDDVPTQPTIRGSDGPTLQLGNAKVFDFTGTAASPSTKEYLDQKLPGGLEDTKKVVLKKSIDEEIASQVQLLPIGEVAKLLGLTDAEVDPYGKTKAKISLANTGNSCSSKAPGKLILVTGMTPTKAGEGKTTTTVGFTDALRLLGKNAVACLREPSLGPVFGMKGGAAGGGWSQVVPMDEINLHFTGDFHAITSAHNLLSAMVDNHMYWQKEPILDARRITWKRVLDMNDRALRKINCGLGGPGNGYPREDGFDITVASEVMAILCLATNFQDLERRLGNICVGYTRKRQMVTAADLGAAGAMAALLKDAFRPNLVQTLGRSPALVHGGPFANIAHGCNSVQATKLGLQLADLVVTEAGFGADLGAEKFCDIKCRQAGLTPSAAVLVVSSRALKLHGGVKQDDLKIENLEAIKEGLANVKRHCENLQKFGLKIFVCVNKFPTDTPAELDLICSLCQGFPNVAAAAVGDHWAQGGEGLKPLAAKLLEYLDSETASADGFRPLYPREMPLKEKVSTIATEIYRARSVVYSDEAATKIKQLQDNPIHRNFPICVAKTQYSFSDDAKKINAAVDHELHVSEVRLNAGAEFIVVICGAIMTMPGLPEKPAAASIGLDSDGNVVGLF
ncbi:unnamed protein product [Amoebophrya sp. A25]|nr:unnamed protein product [Amoebophrya sp. A25]|eukprot:GSA25T00026633001.1